MPAPLRGKDTSMATPPRERDAALMANGGRLLAVGAVLIVIGLALAIALDRTPAGIGVAIAALGSVPAVGGLGMLLSGLASKRARADKPYA
jgi:hypothetical protein